MNNFKRTTAVISIVALSYCFVCVPVACALDADPTFGAGGGAFGPIYWVTLALGAFAFAGWGLTLAHVSQMKKTIYELSVSKRFQVDKGASIAKDFHDEAPQDDIDEMPSYAPRHAPSRTQEMPTVTAAVARHAQAAHMAATDADEDTGKLPVIEAIAVEPNEDTGKLPAVEAAPKISVTVDEIDAAARSYVASVSPDATAEFPAIHVSTVPRSAASCDTAESSLSDIKSAMLADITVAPAASDTASMMRELIEKSSPVSAADALKVEEPRSDSRRKASFTDTCEIPALRVAPSRQAAGRVGKAAVNAIPQVGSAACHAGTSSKIVSRMPTVAAAIPFI